MRLLLVINIILLLCFAGGEAVASDPLSEKDATLLKSAIYVGIKGNWKKGEALASGISDPVGKKVFYWMMLTSGGGASDFNKTASFMQENPDWAKQDILLEKTELALYFDNDKKAEKWFEINPPVSNRGKVKYADILMGKNNKAFDKKIKELIADAWLEDDLCLALEREILKKFRHYLSRQDYINRVDMLIWSGKIERAARLLDMVPNDYEKLFNARIALRKNLSGIDNYVAAVPNHLKNDEGLIYERLAWRHKHKKRPLAMLMSAPEDLSHPEKWWVYREYYIRYLMRRERYQTAYKLASRHGIKSGKEFAQAEWLAGWIAYKFLDDKQTAYNHFKELFKGVEYARSKGRAAYWAGKSSRGSTAEEWFKIAATYGTSFYGQLAALKLNDKVLLTLPEPIYHSFEEKTEFYKKDTTQAVLMLAQIGYYIQAYKFMEHLANSTDSIRELALIAGLGEHFGRIDYTVKIAKLALNDNKIINIGYPMMYIKPETNVENALILAIIRQESEFHTRALSGAGAKGIMQIMPATAKQVAKRHRIKYSEKKLHNSNDYNIAIGSRYLEKVLRRFDNSYPLAIASYNAGPTRVSKWRRRIAKKDIDGMVEWIESIPYSETKDYVIKVLENLQVYRHKFKEEKKSRILLGEDLI